MMKQRILPVAGLLILSGTLATIWPASDQTVSSSQPEVRALEATDDVHSLPSINLLEADSNSPLPPLPPELEGLEPDTVLLTNADGNLVPSHDLRVLLDFFLANIDQEPLTTVLARIRAALSQRLEEPALGQALSLLKRYIGYRMALEPLQDDLPDGMTQTGFDLEVLRQRQERMEQLQHAHFDREEQTAFFGEETQLDNYTLAKLTIEQNPSLTADEKKQYLEQLNQQLPEPIRVARKRAVIHGDVYEHAEALKASNASDTELYQLRARELGEEAALQLAQLDQQQQAWQQRLSQYRQEKSRIVQAGLSEPDQASAITRLRERLFSGPEKLRVRALDGDWRQQEGDY